MTTRSESTGGLKTATAAFRHQGQESPSGRLLSPNTTHGFVEWEARLTTTHDIPLTTEGNMRYGKRSKSNELQGMLGRVTRAVLVIASLAVTRLGVLLLVGW